MDARTFNALYIDDLRPVPDDCEKWTWTTARSFHEAIVKLELIDFDMVSFDHDIASFYGYKEMTGYDIVLWIAFRKEEGIHHVPSHYAVHSANPVGVAAIQGVIDRYLLPDSPK